MAHARLELGRGMNNDRSAGIGEIASKLGRDIHVNNIPRLHNPRPRNAVSRLLVDANAGSARKVIHHPGGRLGALSLQQRRAHIIQLTGRHARLNRGEHSVAHVGHDAANSQNPINITLIIYGHSVPVVFLSWSLLGLYLVFTWSLLGLYLVFTWSLSWFLSYFRSSFR